MVGDKELKDMAQATMISTNLVLEAFNRFMKETKDLQTALGLTDIWFSGIMSTTTTDSSDKLF